MLPNYPNDQVTPADHDPVPGKAKQKAGRRYLGFQAVMFWTVIPVLIVAIVVILILAL